MQALPKLISKTRLMRGYRCLKAIYLTLHNRELEPPVTPALQAKFDSGNEVGEEARRRFPDGVLIDNPPWDFGGALKRTRELIREGKHEVLFEAAFEYKGCFARVDVLRFDPATQRWTMVEVKSANKLKPEYLDDIGLQVFVLANSGLPIERIYLWHLNGECRAPDLSQLFVQVDVTDELRARHTSIAPRLNAIFQAIRQPEIPAVDIGPHCVRREGECQFKAHCYAAKGVPEISVFNIPGLKDKAWELYRAGIMDLRDVDLAELDERQRRMVESHLSGRRAIDAEGVRAALKEWKFPLFFLDFETINPAVPRYAGTRPWQQVPFQFSVHVLRSADAALEHHEFLHLGAGDPRPELVPALLAACTGAGSVVSYYAKFEGDVIAALAEFAPAEAGELESLRARLVDPLPIVREFIYDPGFAGSFSLKAVGPALLGGDFDYSDMAVGDGLAAQREFERTYRGGLSSEETARVRRDMLAYCRQDTLAMVELVRWLRGL